MSQPKENTDHNILPVLAVVMAIRKKEVFLCVTVFWGGGVKEGFQITMHAKMNAIILF